MGGDDGESTSGEVGSSSSGEESTESESVSEVSSEEVADAFGESETEESKEGTSEQSVENTESSKEIQIDSKQVSDAEKEIAFGEAEESKEVINETKDKIDNEVVNIDGKNEIVEVDISELPENVQESYNRYETEGWIGPHSDATTGTKGGGEFENKDGDLPVTDEKGNLITYKEYDVNNKPIDGSHRDGERFVIGSDGSVYYTGNHYDSFTKIR